MNLFLLTLELLKGEVFTIDLIAESLFTASVVRERCREIYEFARHDELKHFQLEQQKFATTTKLVINTISEMYPNHTIPFHSRWRHFETGGVNRWKQLTGRLTLENTERLRIKTELTIISVLLPAVFSYSGLLHESRLPIDGCFLIYSAFALKTCISQFVIRPFVQNTPTNRF